MQCGVFEVCVECCWCSVLMRCQTPTAASSGLIALSREPINAAIALDPRMARIFVSCLSDRRFAYPGVS